MNLTLSQEQYEALIALAQKGTLDGTGAVIPDQARVLDNWLRLIEKANNIKRSILWIQWQEADTPVPTTARFPDKWPPELRYKLEFITRPIARADVEAVLKLKARKPVGVLVTPDPGAVLGWSTLDSFFVA